MVGVSAPPGLGIGMATASLGVSAPLSGIRVRAVRAMCMMMRKEIRSSLYLTLTVKFVLQGRKHMEEMQMLSAHRYGLTWGRECGRWQGRRVREHGWPAGDERQGSGLLYAFGFLHGTRTCYYMHPCRRARGIACTHVGVHV